MCVCRQRPFVSDAVLVKQHFRGSLRVDHFPFVQNAFVYGVRLSELLFTSQKYVFGSVKTGNRNYAPRFYSFFNLLRLLFSAVVTQIKNITEGKGEFVLLVNPKHRHILHRTRCPAAIELSLNAFSQIA